MAKKAMLVVVLVIKPITNTTTNKLLAVKTYRRSERALKRTRELQIWPR